LISPETYVGAVSLKVADLERSVSFYNRMVGLETLSREGGTAVLGAGGRRIVRLEEIRGAPPAPRSATGLYHAAILFPDRHSLAIKVAQIAARRYPFGQSDHLVSEAFYLSDPDENGLELYRDRPRAEWQWANGEVRMAIDPIDFESFFSDLQEGDPALADPSAPASTRLGHIHLRVADLARAEEFYHGLLGFDVTAKMPGALFVSAGGYHHHIGMNTWETRGGAPPVEPCAGLQEFTIVLPHREELERLTRRVEAAGGAVERQRETAVVHDPFRNRIRIALPGLERAA
jgi:catechol 2,3-dioxygenase